MTKVLERHNVEKIIYDYMVANNVGQQGVTGPVGGVGSNGIQGRTGPRGFRGQQGVTGPIGGIGSTGYGATGLRGVTGIRGYNGATGLDGIQGVTGPAGLRGERGQDGARGFPGPQGIPGLGFNIAKFFPSVAALQTDPSPITGILPGEYALINCPDPAQEDHGKLYKYIGETSPIPVTFPAGPFYKIVGTGLTEGLHSFSATLALPTGISPGVNYLISFFEGNSTWLVKTAEGVAIPYQDSGSGAISMLTSPYQPITDMSIRGETGAAGATGPAGLAGLDGIQGVTGLPGGSTQQVATSAITASDIANDNSVEIIPAPGAGKYIDLQQLYATVSVSGINPYPSPLHSIKIVNSAGEASLTITDLLTKPDGYRYVYNVSGQHILPNSSISADLLTSFYADWTKVGGDVAASGSVPSLAISSTTGNPYVALNFDSSQIQAFKMELATLFDTSVSLEAHYEILDAYQDDPRGMIPLGSF